MEVNQWLLANRPPRSFGRFSYDHDLEVEVGDLLARELERRRLKRLMRTCLVTIERGQIYQFPLRKRPVDTIISAVRATNPDAVIVNGASGDEIGRAHVLPPVTNANLVCRLLLVKINTRNHNR